MPDTANIPRHRIAGYIFDQAKELGVDWRFPCNPTLDDLCERGEIADMVPVVAYMAPDDADAVFNGKASISLIRTS